MGASERKAARIDDAAAGERTSSKGRGIRISEELFGWAGEHARIAQRSAPKQVEYWAQLGRLLEHSLGGAELYALLAGRKVITAVRTAALEVPDAATVLAELDLEREAGTLADSVTSAPVIHDLAEDGITLRRHEADGSVTSGVLLDGEFAGRAGE